MINFIEKEKHVVHFFVKYLEHEDVIFFFMFCVARKYIAMIMWAWSNCVSNSASTWDFWSNWWSAKFCHGLWIVKVAVLVILWDSGLFLFESLDEVCVKCIFFFQLKMNTVSYEIGKSRMLMKYWNFELYRFSSSDQCSQRQKWTIKRNSYYRKCFELQLWHFDVSMFKERSGISDTLKNSYWKALQPNIAEGKGLARPVNE